MPTQYSCHCRWTQAIRIPFLRLRYSLSMSQVALNFKTRINIAAAQ